MAINDVIVNIKTLYDKSGMKKAEQDMKRFQRPFAGWAMSIMFAGMAVQRIFTSIAKSGTKSFQEISHSVEGNVTAFDELNSSMKYLGYTIGAALEPLAEFIVPFVDKVAEWVEENPKLTATIIALGIALGTLAMVGGSAKLAIDGLMTALSLFSATKLTGGIAALTVSTPWIAALILVGASLLVLKNALDNNPMFKQNFTSGILNPLGVAFKELWTNLNGLFTEIFGGTGIVDFFGGLLLILTRITVFTLVPALTILIESLGNVFKIMKAIAQLQKGDFAGAVKSFGSVDFASSKIALDAAKKDSEAMFKSLAAGDLTISGQMKGYGPSEKPISIQELNINLTRADSIDDIIEALRRASVGGISS